MHRGLQQIVEAHRLTIERRFSTQQRRISGYALNKLLPDRGYDVVGLLCGSEGTLATTLEATVDLVALPAARVLLVLGFEDPVAAADAVPVLLPHDPLTMESINAALVDRLPAQTRADALRAGLPEGGSWLLVEVGGESAVAAASDGVVLEARASRLRAAVAFTTRGGSWCAGGALAMPPRRDRAGAPTAPRRGPAGGTPRSRPPGWASTSGVSTS